MNGEVELVYSLGGRLALTVCFMISILVVPYCKRNNSNKCMITVSLGRCRHRSNRGGSSGDGLIGVIRTKRQRRLISYYGHNPSWRAEDPQIQRLKI